MPNYFDRYDETPAQPIAGATPGNYFDKYDEPGFDLKRSAIDVGKQLGAGLVTGTEAIPAFPAQAAGLLGPLAERVLPQSWLSPERAQEQATLRDIIEKNRGGGIAQYLPQPETTAGKYARSVGEFIPSTVAGTKLSIPRAAGVGATAGLTSEAAGQATQGTEAEPYARVGGALLGGTMALQRAQAAATRAAVPSIEELKIRAGSLYEQVRNSGLEIRPEAASGFAQRIKADLTQTGHDDIIAPKTWAILSKLDNAPPGAVMTPQNFQSLRQTLGRAAGSLDPQERFAAVQAKNQLDDFLANLTPAEVRRGNPQQASALLGEANANYAAAERAGALDKRTTAAELRAAATHSGLNLENTIRSRMAQVLQNPGMQRGYSPAELAEMRGIVEGKNIANLNRWIGGLLGRGGGLGAVVGGGGIGAGAGYLLGGDPTSTAALGPAAGLTLALLGNRATLNRARALENMVRARSPLAAQTALPAPAAATPLAFLPPNLSNLGVRNGQ